MEVFYGCMAYAVNLRLCSLPVKHTQERLRTISIFSGLHASLICHRCMLHTYIAYKELYGLDRV